MLSWAKTEPVMTIGDIAIAMAVANGIVNLRIAVFPLG